MPKDAENQTTETVKKGGYSDEWKTKCVACLKLYLDKEELSQNKAASASYLDVSSTTLGNIRNGKWEGIADELWRKVWEKVCKHDVREWKLLKTKNHETGMQTCFFAKDHSSMVWLLGPAGNGKTTTLFKAAERFNLGKEEKVAFYVECKDTDTRKDFVYRVMKAMGLKPKGSVGNCIDEIADYCYRLPKPVLLLDEASCMSEKQILAIKALQNATTDKDSGDGWLGIVLAGVNYSYSAISKGAETEKQGYPEVFSRITYPSELARVSEMEFSRICNANGIGEENAFKTNKQGELKDTDEVRKWLFVHTGGDLRKLRFIAKIIFNEWGGGVRVEQLETAFPKSFSKSKK
jgi:AAA domain